MGNHLTLVGGVGLVEEEGREGGGGGGGVEGCKEEEEEKEEEAVVGVVVEAVDCLPKRFTKSNAAACLSIAARVAFAVTILQLGQVKTW